MTKVKASDVPTLREALEAIADGEGDAVVIAQQTLDANPVADASKSRWRAECTECVGTGCSQTEAPCSACGGSGNVPGSEWRDTPQAAMADHPATRLEALQAQPVGALREALEGVSIARVRSEMVMTFPNDEQAIAAFEGMVFLCDPETAFPPVVEREAVNRILAELLAPSMPDVAERIEVGNHVCSLILAGLSTPVAQGDEIRDALEDLEVAERNYRLQHDLHGDDDMRAGKAWDEMRRAGDRARATLTKGARDAG